MTQEDINKAIKKCKWRDTKMGEVFAICRGMCTPCLRVIDSGKCDTLIELFKKEKKE